MGNRKKKYLTTPLYYLNGKPHLGHAYTSILTDTFSRFYKLLGYDVFFQTGVDEHGLKVSDSAKEAGLEPQEQCDILAKEFRNLADICKVEYDNFFRTTDKCHVKKVQAVLNKLYEKGDIYKGIYSGNYCKPCETYYTEKDLVDGKCPECGRETNILEEENYFFDMPKYAKKLEDYINSHPDFIKPDFRKNEVLGILKKGLTPLCISRNKEKLTWGIELPFDKDFVTFVWFDALSNYTNGLGYLDDDEIKEKRFDEFWALTSQFIAKDILMHHTVYWTTMLFAMDLPLPENILIHGFWISDGKKMSKSFGNVVDPYKIIDEYGIDSFRFYLLREMSLGHDGNFTLKSFIDRYNTELANDFGNMINRSVHMIVKNFDSSIPSNNNKKTEYCDDFINGCNSIIPNIEPLLKNFEINKIFEEIFKIIRSTNKYLEDTAPWKLIKTDKELCGSVLRNALEAVRFTGLLLSPVVPVKFEELKKIFVDEFDFTLEFGKLKTGAKIAKIDSLFPKLEFNEKAEEEAEKKKKLEDNLIEFDDFKKIAIKTVKIIKAELVADSDRLLYLDVDFGNKDIRKIVAGIAKFYSAEEVVGLSVLAVANLKPAKIRGLDSEGMLLTIKKGKKFLLVTVDGELPIGKKLV